MNEYIDFMREDRRLCILRILKELNGSANDRIIHSALERLGHVRVPSNDIREDLRFLIANGCITDDWYGDVQVVTLTKRGVEVAEGRITVKGIKQPSIGV